MLILSKNQCNKNRAITCECGFETYFNIKLLLTDDPNLQNYSMSTFMYLFKENIATKKLKYIKNRGQIKF